MCGARPVRSRWSRCARRCGRRAPGDVVEVVGTHPSSKKEIPMAVKALGLELLSVEEEGDAWKIRIRR